MTEKLKKFLTFDEGSMTVTVHDTEDAATDSGGEALGTFVHEFNIDPFSGVKYPVLEQHVLGLLREKTDDVAVKAAINIETIHIVPGYQIDVPANERNQSYDGVRKEDGHVTAETSEPAVKATRQPRQTRVRKDKDGKDEVVQEGQGNEKLNGEANTDGDTVTKTSDLPEANQTGSGAVEG